MKNNLTAHSNSDLILFNTLFFKRLLKIKFLINKILLTYFPLFLYNLENFIVN
jgi:hypothetical protein